MSFTNYLIDGLMLLIIVAIIIFGELHLKMDKNRSIAEHSLKKLENSLSVWVACAEKLTVININDTELQTKLTSTIHSYNELTKKQIFKRPATLNEIHRLVKIVVTSDGQNPDVIETGKQLTQLFATFVDTVDKYNSAIYRLSKQLNQPLYSLVAKISKFKKLDSIVNLTVI